MAGEVERFPLDVSNIEVLGHRVKDTSPAWTGLDWTRAVLRDNRSKLSIPWCHPEEQSGDPDDFDCTYSVYPQAMPDRRWRRRMVKDAWFESDGPKWFVVVEFATPHKAGTQTPPG